MPIGYGVTFDCLVLRRVLRIWIGIGAGMGSLIA